MAGRVPKPSTNITCEFCESGKSDEISSKFIDKIIRVNRDHKASRAQKVDKYGPRKLMNVVKTTNSAKGHWPSPLKRLFKRIEIIWLKGPDKVDEFGNHGKCAKICHAC